MGIDSDLEQRIAGHCDRDDLAQAATEAIRGYGPQILGYLTAVTRSESDAAEVFSRFTVDLWNGLAGFRRDCSFRTWLYKVAFSASVRFQKDAFRRRGRPLEEGHVSQVAAEVYSRTAPHLRTAVKDRMHKLRERLGDDERTLLILRLDRELSWSEVADVLSAAGRAVDEAAVRKRFERLKEKMRRLAREEGLLGDD